jgi:hypothetical protein
LRRYGEVAASWDFVHCPPVTNHVIVGAGATSCVVFGVGSREQYTEIGPDGAPRGAVDGGVYTSTPWRAVMGRASTRRRRTRKSRMRGSPRVRKPDTRKAGFRPSSGYHRPRADVAQLVEHQLPKLRVAGSNPVVRFKEAPHNGAFVWLVKQQEAPEEPVVRPEGEGQAQDEPGERERWF